MRLLIVLFSFDTFLSFENNSFTSCELDWIFVFNESYSNESLLMALIKQDEQVIYVEPNAMDDITLYNTQNGKVYKSTELENLCISVDLEVEVTVFEL